MSKTYDEDKNVINDVLTSIDYMNQSVMSMPTYKTVEFHPGNTCKTTPELRPLSGPLKVNIQLTAMFQT